MTIRFYLDVIILVNFAVDYLIIEIEKKLLKKKVGKKRQFFSALFGAFLGTFVFVVRVENDRRMLIGSPVVLGILTMLVSMVILYLIQKTAFPKINQRSMIRQIVYFYIFSFIIAGSILMLHSVLYAQKSVGALELLGIVMLICLMVPVMMVVLQGMREEMELISPATIIIGHYIIKGKAFWDSGNHLFDPGSERPVCIVKGNWIEQYIDKEQIEKTKFLINYHSLGNQDGNLWAITADEIRLGEDKKQKIYFEVVLAMAEQNFFADEEIQMILNSSLKI